VSLKFSFERLYRVTRTDVNWKLVPCTWTCDRKCPITKRGAHPANTKVTVCHRPKVVSNFRCGCRTAKIGEVTRCRCRQKVDREGAEVTLGGRLFQTRAAATGKARSPTVKSRAWNEQRCRRCGSKSPTGASIRDAMKIS